MLSWLIGLIKLILTLSHFLSVFKGENLTKVISSKKICSIGLYLDVYRLISLKLGVVTDTTLCSLIPVCVDVTFIRGHSYVRKQNFYAHFHANFPISLYEIRYAAIACGHVKLALNFVYLIYSRE